MIFIIELVLMAIVFILSAVSLCVSIPYIMNSIKLKKRGKK
jgi:hypothetical protein